MIKNRCFIVFSDDYGRHPSSCQHLIKRFLLYNRVLWVNSIGLRAPQATLNDFSRGLAKIKSWISPLVRWEKNLWVYSPVSLPWNHLPFIRRKNREWGIKGIKKVLRKISFEKVISITTVPNSCDWVSELGEELKIYYCVDDFSLWPGMEKDLVLRMEGKLLKKVDLLVATSQKLLNSKKISGKPSLFLPHGVDVEHFKKAHLKLKPEERKNLWPCIGYFGLVDERLDFDLIRFLVRGRPDWNWAFIGPIAFCPDDLRQSQNCHFYPAVSYAQLPEGLRQFDALFLPYKLSALTEAINPLKLRECIATGKPVVSVALPEVLPYQDVIQVGRTPEEFLNLLEKYVAGEWKVDMEKMWKRIQNETWEARAETLAGEIEKRLGSR